MRPYYFTIAAVFLVTPALLTHFCCTPDNRYGTIKNTKNAAARLELIRPAPDGTRFVGAQSGATFLAWGFNYDHDADGRLLEDYWFQQWPTVVQDFREIKALGANIIRIHLQTAKFMNAPREPNQVALNQLARLLQLADQTRLYLDITGLGCYHKADVPPWYDPMSEAERWEVHALFWQAVAKTCAHSPAVFCYDLMNEPVLPGANKPENEWLVGEFAGKSFVQRITLDLAGRTRQNVAKDWVEKLVAAIRKHDRTHMVTVGVIPWAYTFPGARPLFYSDPVAVNLDFVSVHFYPEKGMLDKALKALAVYDIGKPIVVEEIFPLKCGTDEIDVFIDASAKIADGWIGFYWGRTIEEYSKPDIDLPGAITRDWLKYFKAKTPDILHPRSHPGRL